jgi:hypothetical protein
MPGPLQCLHWISHFKYYTYSLLFIAAVLQLTLFFTAPHTELNSQLNSPGRTDGQSISKSWCWAPSGAHDHIFFTLWQLRSCFRGALSDERKGLYFVHAAGPRQRRLSRFFTVSDFRLPFSSPPMTRRVTVEGINVKVGVKVMLRPMVRLARLSWNKAPIWDLRPDLYLILEPLIILKHGPHRKCLLFL